MGFDVLSFGVLVDLSRRRSQMLFAGALTFRYMASKVTSVVT